MELREALPVLPKLEEILEEANWERRAFVHSLGMGNALISQMNASSYQRYQLHQEFNRYLSELRAEKLGEEAKVVFGFFHHGEAEEVSLFAGHPEIVEELFCISAYDEPFDDIIIGYGCKDLSVSVLTQFDTSVDHNWGWVDGFGEHVEYYDAASRTFYRRSMSGRTCYRLLIAEDGIAIPQP